ncbi:MAG: hypothetical protein HOP19_06615 [Acidobacteria bacterium]|nr:hypothetical protein [Acidobacteriota bacterium]
MSLQSKHLYEFGPFSIDPEERVLFRDGRPLALPPKSFDTLIALVERSGHIVEKDELMQKVWPDTFVEEVNLARHVSNLRKVLGEEGGERPYIETVARRGYRFNATVRAVSVNAPVNAMVVADEAEELVVETRTLARIVTQEIEEEKVVLPVAALPAGTESSGTKWLKWAAACAVIAVIGFGLWRWFNQSEAARPAAAFKTVPFTSFPGAERDPAFSPDGSRLAYTWNGEKQGNFDIYVQVIKAGPPLRLTSHPDRDIAPAWSPDGSYLAFARVSNNERAIYTIPALGGPERKLLTINAASETWITARLSWSPDGKFIAFAGAGSIQTSEGITLLTVDTLEHRRFLPTPAEYLDLAPAFSPDGQTLAFIRSHGSSNRDIYLVPSTGGEARRLTNENRWIDNLAWTADSREIVFLAGQGPSQTMRRVAVADGVPRELPLGDGNGYEATISLLGHRLAYTQLQLDWNITRWANPVSSGKPSLSVTLIASTKLDSHPQYSPDGNQIVFTSERSGHQEIWMSDSEGSNQTRLTHFNGPLLGTPRWSPDSRQIAFDCAATGVKDIYVVSVEGDTPRRLTTDAAEEVRPSWSRDGKWIYFGSNRTGDWQVWKTPVAGGSITQLTRHGGREAFESFDAQFVYYFIDNARTGLWRVPVTGGEETRVIERAAQGHWALSSAGIYFLTPASDRSSTHIQLFDFASGQIKTLLTMDRELIVKGPGFSISPDERWFLYANLDQSGSDLVLIENFR